MFYDKKYHRFVSLAHLEYGKMKNTTSGLIFTKLDFIDKSSLDLLRKFAYQIKDEFHTLNTSFDYSVKEEEENKTPVKTSFATFHMNNHYIIECRPAKDINLSSQWDGFVYKGIEGNHKELVFTFSFTNKNLSEIGTTIKVFCAGTPAFNVNQ